MQAALLSERMRLNIFRNFSRWSSRISEDAGQPCVQCTKMLLNAGVTEIIFSEGYPDGLALQLLQESGIKVRKLD